MVDETPTIPSSAKGGVEIYPPTYPDVGAEIDSKLLELAADGYSQSRMAKFLKRTPETIRRHLVKLENEGKLTRTNKYPAMYRKNEISAPHQAGGTFLPPTFKSGPEITPSSAPLVRPKKYGASFFMLGRPNLTYDAWGKAKMAEGTHTAIFGRHKTVIWLHSFVGGNVAELVANADRALIELAQKYSAFYGITLNFDRQIGDEEWVVVSKSVSRKMAEAAGIEKGGQVVVDGVIHKYDDFSDPDHVQFNRAPGGRPEGPREHAKVHEYLYSGKLADDLLAMKDVMAAMSDSLVAIHQRLNMRQ